MAVIGLKILRADGSSLREDGRVTYPVGEWITVPGHGAYVAMRSTSLDGLRSGGDGPLMVAVECEEPTGAGAFRDDDVQCFRRVRRIGAGCECLAAWAEYERVRVAAHAEYDRVCAPARAEYERVRAPARAEYDRVRATAWAEYERVCVAAHAEYDRVCAPARAEYERVRATARAEYDRVCAPAHAEYDRVRAPAWAEYERACVLAWDAMVVAACGGGAQ